MFRGDRGERNPHLGAYGILLAIFLCTIIAGVLSYSSGRESERRDNAPASYSRAAKQDAQRACVGMETGTTFECIYEKVESSQEQARGEQDLSAQQRAAAAAMISALIALLTLIATALGVWLVKRTLDATLEAVKDTSEATKAMKVANEIAKAAQRPWVSIEVSPKIMQQGNGVINYECEMFFKNIGLTVAKNFSFNYEIVFILPDRLDADNSQWNKWENPVHKSKSVLMPSDASGHLASRSFKMTDIAWLDMGSTSPRVMMPVIAVSAFYQVADGDGWHRTDRAFRIGRRGRDSDCLAIEETVNRLKPPDLTTAPYGHTLAT